MINYYEMDLSIIEPLTKNELNIYSISDREFYKVTPINVILPFNNDNELETEHYNNNLLISFRTKYENFKEHNSYIELFIEEFVIINDEIYDILDSLNKDSKYQKILLKFIKSIIDIDNNKEGKKNPLYLDSLFSNKTFLDDDLSKLKDYGFDVKYSILKSNIDSRFGLEGIIVGIILKEKEDNDYSLYFEINNKKLSINSISFIN